MPVRVFDGGGHVQHQERRHRRLRGPAGHATPTAEINAGRRVVYGYNLRVTRSRSVRDHLRHPVGQHHRHRRRDLRVRSARAGHGDPRHQRGPRRRRRAALMPAAAELAQKPTARRHCLPTGAPVLAGAPVLRRSRSARPRRTSTDRRERRWRRGQGTRSESHATDGAGPSSGERRRSQRAAARVHGDLSHPSALSARGRPGRAAARRLPCA